MFTLRAGSLLNALKNVSTLYMIYSTHRRCESTARPPRIDNAVVALRVVVTFSAYYCLAVGRKQFVPTLRKSEYYRLNTELIHD